MCQESSRSYQACRMNLPSFTEKNPIKNNVIFHSILLKLLKCLFVCFLALSTLHISPVT